MKIKALDVDKLITERLLLIPYTINICEEILNNDYTNLISMGLKTSQNWPDEDVLETLPRIINNLESVEEPTGFESWMIVKKETLEVIGDLGFKGFNFEENNADIGYGIIKEERRKGYAEEAMKELINWAFLNGFLKEITAKCLIGNVNSINLLTKFNFLRIKTDHEMIYWTLKNENFVHKKKITER
jgi:ribosomal-protein-alanine N-acetyltransferase